MAEDTARPQGVLARVEFGILPGVKENVGRTLTRPEKLCEMIPRTGEEIGFVQGRER